MLQLHAELKVVGGKQDGKIIPLTTNKFLIGREQDCQLRPNSELVSRHHCVFSLDDFGLRLRDLGSTNGTFVNNEQIRGQVVLKSGDRVHVGKLEFEVRISEVAPVQQPAAEPAAPAASIDLNEQPNALESRDIAELSSSDTNYDLPAVQSPEESASGSGVYGGDTTIISQDQLDPSQQQAAVQNPQQPVAPYPQQPVIPYPQQPIPFQQPSIPYQPQFPQPVMYPQQPVMYPQQPVMYPQQPVMYPQQPAPATPAEPLEERAAGSVPEPPVRLPPPESTGAVPPTPAEEGSSDQSAAEGNPSQHAADIIKKYTQRRPEV